MDCSTKDRQGCKKQQEYGPSGVLCDAGACMRIVEINRCAESQGENL